MMNTALRCALVPTRSKVTARRSERIKGGSEATEATIQPKCRAGTRHSGHRPRNSLAGVADRLTEAGQIDSIYRLLRRGLLENVRLQSSEATWAALPQGLSEELLYF